MRMLWMLTGCIIRRTECYTGSSGVTVTAVTLPAGVNGRNAAELQSHEKADIADLTLIKITDLVCYGSNQSTSPGKTNPACTRTWIEWTGFSQAENSSHRSSRYTIAQYTVPQKLDGKFQYASESEGVSEGRNVAEQAASEAQSHLSDKFNPYRLKFNTFKSSHLILNVEVAT
ncbi:hypothetical protein MHYP_G00304040 [Metynnis hypsauchen]